MGNRSDAPSETAVKVYEFTVYNITSGETRLSTRMGTFEAIETTGGNPLLHTERWVEKSELDWNGFCNPPA